MPLYASRSGDARPRARATLSAFAPLMPPILVTYFSRRDDVRYGRGQASQESTKRVVEHTASSRLEASGHDFRPN